MKQICTKFGLLYHNTRVWNSKCLIFYEYFAFLLNATCKFFWFYYFLSGPRSFSQTVRIILIAILQTQHALRGFTIRKKCFFTVARSIALGKFAFSPAPQNENHLRRNSEVVFYSQARQPQTQDARTGSNAQVTSKPVIRHQNSIKRARLRQGKSRCFSSIFCATCAVYVSLRA